MPVKCEYHSPSFRKERGGFFNISPMPFEPARRSTADPKRAAKMHIKKRPSFQRDACVRRILLGSLGSSQQALQVTQGIRQGSAGHGVNGGLSEWLDVYEPLLF